jgi:hypothetical protein
MANFYASALAAGGGTGTIVSPFTWAEMISYINASFANGDIAWIKNDATYSGVSPFSITKVAAITAPCIMEGYTTTPGDGGMPTVIRSSPAASIFATINTAYWIFKNMIWDANNQGTNTVGGSASTIFINNTFRRAGAGGASSGATAQYINCKAENNASYGINGGICSNCLAVNNGTVGYIADNGIWNCVSANNGGYGVQITTTGGSIRNCVINGNTGGGITTAASVVTIINNLITNHASGYGINFTAGAGNTSFAYNNDFYNNSNNTNIAGNIINSGAVNPNYNNTSLFDFRRTDNAISGIGLGIVGITGGFNYETTPGIAPAKIGSGTLPTFAGITGLVSNADGTLQASWSLPTDAEILDIFVQANTATGLFSTHNNIALSVESNRTSAIIKTLYDNTFLNYALTYYVGVRAENAFGYETNVVSLSAIPNNNINVTIPLIPQNTWNYLTSAITTSGSIGKLLKDNIDATISGIAAAVWGYGTRTLTSIANFAQDVWDYLTSSITTSGSIGKLLKDDIDTTISSRASQTSITSMQADVTIIKGLSQNNYRILSPIYDGNNNLTSATLRIYPTATDTNNDTSPIASYLLTATYDVNNNLITYKVTLV